MVHPTRENLTIRCSVIGPPEAVAQAVLAHDPLSVALTILQIEWMSQRHYLESVKDNGDLDPQFKSLLRHHWMEEAQHAKLDTLMVEALASIRSGEEIDRDVDGYLDIGGFLDGGLKQQVEFDLESFVLATGRELSNEERAEFIKVQLQANRWTYLGSEDDPSECSRDPREHSPGREKANRRRDRADLLLSLAIKKSSVLKKSRSESSGSRLDWHRQHRRSSVFSLRFGEAQ